MLQCSGRGGERGEEKGKRVGGVCVYGDRRAVSIATIGREIEKSHCTSPILCSRGISRALSLTCSLMYFEFPPATLFATSFTYFRNSREASAAAATATFVASSGSGSKGGKGGQQQQQSESAEGGNDDDGNKNEEKGGDGGEGAAADMVEEEEAGSLEVGDQILYNDTRSGPAGTDAARRETVILEIKKSEKYPLRLQNGGCLESSYDHVKKVKTADGKETGATRSFRIDKFHLVDGILDKVTDREAAAARLSQEMVGIATEFPEVRK